MYKLKFVNIIAVLSLTVHLISCTDNPTEPKPTPKTYIPVDTASRYEWTVLMGGFPTNDFNVVDTSNIFIATGSRAVKYDGIQFSLLDLGDNRFYCQGLHAVNKDCIFFVGETRVNMNYLYPTVKRYINGNVSSFDFPSDTLFSIYSVFGLSSDEFWAVASFGRLYHVKNSVVQVFHEFENSNGGGKFYRYPDGRLLLIIVKEDYNTFKSVVSVNKLLNGEVSKLTSDTLNEHEIGFLYDFDDNIILSKQRSLHNRDLYYFNGNQWEKFFSVDDLEPYFTFDIFACGGKSKNEFMINSNGAGAPLLYKDGKWNREYFYGFGWMTPKITFYNDRIYFMTNYYEIQASYLYKGKLRNH